MLAVAGLVAAAAPAAARATPRRAAPPAPAPPRPQAPAGPAPAPPGAPAPPPAPRAWLLVDADTGNVIDAGNDREPLAPASLTKILTALTATAVLDDDATVPVSARAEAAPAHNLSMKAGQVWRLQDALHALLLSSANDSAVALAERAGGSVEQFATMMGTAAAALGMQDGPVLHDPAGLDGTDAAEGGNLLSARDLAIAARAVLASPELAPVVAQREYRFTGPDGTSHRLVNHNQLLRTYPGAIGMKTGYTRRAGGCLIAAARRDGRTMLAVVLHAPNTYAATTPLLDKGFATPVEAENPAGHLPPTVSDLRPALDARVGAAAGGGRTAPAQGSQAAAAVTGPAAAKTAVDVAPQHSSSSKLPAAPWWALGALAVVTLAALVRRIVVGTPGAAPPRPESGPHSLTGPVRKASHRPPASRGPGAQGTLGTQRARRSHRRRRPPARRLSRR